MDGALAAAQAQVAADAEVPPVAAPLAPGPLALDVGSAASGRASVTRIDGSRLAGNVLQYAPGERLVLEHEGQIVNLGWAELQSVQFEPVSLPGSSPIGAAKQTPDLAVPEPMRGEELSWLLSRRDVLRAGNRRWGSAAAGVILGFVLTISGAGALYYSSLVELSDCFPAADACDEPSSASFRAAIALLTLGPAMLLVFTPMLVTRATRASRLKRVEQAIQRLGGTLSLSPLLAPSGGGLSARARF